MLALIANSTKNVFTVLIFTHFVSFERVRDLGLGYKTEGGFGCMPIRLALCFAVQLYC